MTKKENEILGLSKKLLNMGMALVAQGTDNKNETIINTGSFLLLISGVIVNPKDVNEFGKICEEFALNKIKSSVNLEDNLELTMEEHFNLIQSLYSDLESEGLNEDVEDCDK
jgi:hypothetical protein